MRMLLVVDYQNDFVSGSLGFPGAEKLDGPIAALVGSYRESRDLVTATKDTHEENYLDTREGRTLPVPHCIRGSEGWDFYGKTKDALTAASAAVINKPGFPLRPADMLDTRLFPDGVDDILIVGLVTNMCVLANAFMLRSRYPEAEIKVSRSLCASFDPVLHEKTLDVLAGAHFIIAE
ncbi:MAG: cysteine hydrolase [Gracilibacteraceae bacterium]|jgi:nicotinamidase-related amidase|nr:cysteine hydrolase [Gracilibacteraceae bacterium]